MATSGGQFSRLATLSHVLYDREVLELRRENERLRKENQALKLEKFWKEYDLPRFRRLVTLERIRYRLNTNERPFNTSDISSSQDWHQWMGPLIQSHGLDYEVVHDSYPTPSNVHFVCDNLDGIKFYGTKLLNAKSTEDPELQKFKALVDALQKALDTHPPLKRPDPIV
jgi:hypothetical protein